MAVRVRRSAGSNKYLNMVLFRKTRPEIDLESYRDGVGFKMVSLFRRLEDVGRPGTLVNGFLTLVPGEPVTWRGRTGVTLLLGPFELTENTGKLPLGGNFTKCLLSTKDNDYELAVPTVDLPLLRLALGLETPATAD